MKKCSNCNCEKELSSFYPLKKYPGKFSSRCIDCSKIKAIESYNKKYLSKEGSASAREQRSRINEARAAGNTHFIPVVPCPIGHLSKRLVSTQQCCKCLTIRKKKLSPSPDNINPMKISQAKRKFAVNMGNTHYFTGIACKNGHIAKRLVSTRQCTECLAKRKRGGAISSKSSVDRRNAKRRKRAAKVKQRAYQKDVLFKRTGYRLAVFCRGALSRTIGFKKTSSTSECLGYKRDQLKMRIEFQFKEGMSWDNYGEWHIDHKKPIVRFISQGITDPKIINALSNLQPMWAKENLSKGKKF